MTTPTTNLGLLKGVDADNWRTYLKTDLAGSLDVLDRAIGQVVNVKGYGATGDGTTDDSAAILAAVAALPSTGGRVYFPPGVYWAPNLTTINRSRLTIDLAGATLTTTSGLSLVGDHNTVDLGGGTIDGGLRYTTVAVAAPSGSTTITVADGSVFHVGDGVQSSYGLGGDGSNPIAITAIAGNVLTVATATFGVLPVGARIGTWVWNGLVSLDGHDNAVRDGLLTNVRGIAVDVRTGSTRVRVESIATSAVGLQSLEVLSATAVVVRGCAFGPVLDAAKQSVGIEGATSAVAFEDCTFQPFNSDAIFFVGGAAAPATDEASITLTRCTLDAVGGAMPAPYANNGAAIYQNGGMLRQLTLRDCVVKNYRFGIATDTNSAAGTSARRVILDGCDFSAGIAPYSWFLASHVPTQVLQSTNCRFNCSVVDFWSTTGSFDACVFDACAFDAASSFGGRMIGCAFLSSTGVKFVSSAFLEGCVFNATTIGTYPLSGPDKLLGELHLGEVLFGHADFPSGTLANVVALQADHAMSGHLREMNSTLPLVFYQDHGGVTRFLVDCRTAYQPYPTQLRGKDWLIPVGSLFSRMTLAGPARSSVLFSSPTTLNGAVAATAASIVVASGAGFAVGQVLNVLCTDGRVHTTIVSSVAGTTIGLTDAMPFAAASGAGVCAYAYAPLTDPEAWTVYNPTWTGFSANPTGGMRYKQVGKTVFVRSSLSANGTSNATGLTFTLPVTAQSTQVCAAYGLGTDNGAAVTTPCRIDLSSTTVATAYTSPAAGAWTNTGPKGIHFAFTYEAG